MDALAPFSRFGRAYARHRYAALFYALLLTLGVGPVLQAIRANTVLLELFLGASLLAAILPTRLSGRRKWLVIGAIAAVGALRFLASWVGVPGWTGASDALWAGVGLLAAIGALRFSLRSAEVDTEHLYAALGAYLLAGIFLGVLYAAMERSWPGSFSLPSGSTESGLTTVSAIYFSFVTLATLGYGDILPRSDAARGLAILEAIVGQLYLAVMVARLISVYAPMKGRR